MERWLILRRSREAHSSLRALVFHGTSEEGSCCPLRGLPLSSYSAAYTEVARSSLPQESRTSAILAKVPRHTPPQSRESTPRTARHRSSCSSSSSISSSSWFLIRSSASRNLRQPAVLTSTVTIARAQVPPWITPRRGRLGDATWSARHTGRPGHGDPRLDHAMGVPRSTYDSLRHTILTSFTPRQSACVLRPRARSSLRLAARLCLWVQKSLIALPVVDHASSYLNRWTRGTLSQSRGQIAEWMPIVSSAVGVHMELLDHGSRISGRL